MDNLRFLRVAIGPVHLLLCNFLFQLLDSGNGAEQIVRHALQSAKGACEVYKVMHTFLQSGQFLALMIVYLGNLPLQFGNLPVRLSDSIIGSNNIGKHNISLLEMLNAALAYLDFSALRVQLLEREFLFSNLDLLLAHIGEVF